MLLLSEFHTPENVKCKLYNWEMELCTRFDLKLFYDLDKVVSKNDKRYPCWTLPAFARAISLNSFATSCSYIKQTTNEMISIQTKCDIKEPDYVLKATTNQNSGNKKMLLWTQCAW